MRTHCTAISFAWPWLCGRDYHEEFCYNAEKNKWGSDCDVHTHKSVRCHDTYLYVKKPCTYRVTYNSRTIRFFDKFSIVYVYASNSYPRHKSMKSRYNSGLEGIARCILFFFWYLRKFSLERCAARRRDGRAGRLLYTYNHLNVIL